MKIKILKSQQDLFSPLREEVGGNVKIREHYLLIFQNIAQWRKEQV